MTTPNRYPQALEEWWIDQACRRYRTEDRAAAVRRLISAADRLSNLFTVERGPDFGDYTQSDELILAYGLYLFPQTFVRSSFLMQELEDRHPFPATEEPIRILDLGGGSGAASLAVAHSLGRPAALTLVDSSPLALNHARFVHRDLPLLWPQSKLSIQEQKLSPGGEAGPAGPWDVIVCSFALGEIFAERPDEQVLAWVEKLLAKLTPGGRLLLLEPALAETTRRIMRLRDAVAARQIPILSPCPHALACPMLPDRKHWCHEVRTWQPTPGLQRLNSTLKRRIHELKWSHLVLQPGPVPGESSLARLVAPMAKLKGQFATRACCHDGQLREIFLNTAKMETAERRRIKGLSRGDLVRLGELAELKTPGSYRAPGADSVQAVWTPDGESLSLADGQEEA